MRTGKDEEEHSGILQQYLFRELPKNVLSVDQGLSVFKHFRKPLSKKKKVFGIQNSNDWCWWQSHNCLFCDYYYDPTILAWSGEEKCNMSYLHLLCFNKQGNRCAKLTIV